MYFALPHFDRPKHKEFEDTIGKYQYLDREAAHIEQLLLDAD